MRPAGRGATESLYFTYPSFAAPNDRARLGEPTPVVIVGAGPVGMTAALSLAREGTRCVLIDAKDTFNDGSRAICVARQSFRIFERIGAVAPFLEKSLPWTTGRTFYRGRQILEFDMPDSADEKFRPMYNIEQQYIEAYLWDAIAREPLIDARWQSAAVAIEDAEDGVRLTIRDPHGEYTLPAAWCLAADGARSPIRKLRGLRLKGENYEGRYVIADVQMKHDYPTIRRALFDPDCRRGGTILVHKQPDDIWRIDYQLRDGEDEAEALREENVRASVAAVLEEIGHEGAWELEWWSVYSANTLALDDYRDGRVVFIGDSAHIVPIFGVRGLNNGLADAENIAWKLARVLRGEAPEALVDSYTPERRGATLDVFANATKSARFMTPPTPGWTLMRDAALSLALRHPFAGALANPRQMTPYTYAESPLTTGAGGEVLADVRVGDGFLSDRLGPGFTLVHRGAQQQMASPAGLAQVALDPDPAERLGLPPGGAVLVRPDGHVAARWDAPTLEDIRAALSRALGGEIA
ncbi:FAD-dependent monooxygenase [Rhodovulum sp. DZ06]|uniref:FAD-dependent monooxygenase n=1 Tax=Rhodovulum sp. DZ06 TaxID=3425126 RepID=UPI003D32A4D0